MSLGEVELPGYRDFRPIARGADSIVYRARQNTVDRDVAVKVLLLEDPDTIARFQRELEITVRLGRQHPHIVTVIDTGVLDTGQPCIVMQFYDSGSVHDQLRASGPLPVADVLTVGSVIADALAFAHTQGVLHRDVKPQNILVLPTSYVLADFGIARRADAGHSTSAERFSYRHAAPQVLDGQSPSASDDIYALGSTLYTLLEGHAPYATDDPYSDAPLAYIGRVRTQAPRPMTRLDVPEDLVEVVSRCLAKHPDDRFDTAAGLYEQLSAITTDARVWIPPATPPPVVASGAVAVTPRQLPTDVAGFTGRTDSLRVLAEWSSRSGAERARAVVISAIAGTAGVGKTALALHWAHRAAGRYPDGQLYVNLRGYGPGPELTAHQVLGQFLRGLGVAPEEIPLDPDERSALYRSTLAGKRALVVLDNAATAAQVRPLLPGSGACLVLVTSRDRLSGLVAKEGARRITLDVLSPAEAVDLLVGVVGQQRIDAEPVAAAELAELCGRLPLALRIAAANLADRPQQTLTSYAARLRDGNRVSMLAVGGDEEAAVRVIFDLYYERLEPEVRRQFRLLGLHPGGEIGTFAAAALAHDDPHRTQQLLDVLAGAHLIQQTATDRYQLHDLMRGYAADRAQAEESELDRRAALTRLFDWYLHTATLAAHRLEPDRPAPAGTTRGPELIDRETAIEWLESERANQLAVTQHAAEHGWLEHAWRLPAAFYPFFWMRNHVDDTIATHRLALAAARRLDDRTAEAEILHNLGFAHWGSGGYLEALPNLQQALDLRRTLGDHRKSARTLNALGVIHQQLARYVEAVDYFGQSLTINRQWPDRRGEAYALGNLGVVNLRLGRHAEALGYLRESLELFRELGDAISETVALGNLGHLYERLGRYPEALDHLRLALARCRESGHRGTEAFVLGVLGVVHVRLGSYPEALAFQHESLELSERIGDRNDETEALNELGATCCAAGRHHDAVVHHRRALELAGQTGNRYELARAHRGIGAAMAATGQTEPARQHLQQALELFVEFQVPEADEVRAALEASAGP